MFLPLLLLLSCACGHGLLLDRYAELGRVPLRHAHNDYWHPHPLRDALAADYESIEADVHLLQGELYIGHDQPDVRPRWTLQGVYLDPLVQLFRDDPEHIPLVLVVDIKSSQAAALARLDAVLRNSTYATLITRFPGGGAEPEWKPLVVYVTAPPDTMDDLQELVMETALPRVMGVDGFVRHLSDPRLADVLLALYVDHTNWEQLAPFGDAAERGILVRSVDTADDPDTWGAMREAGVTALSSDHLQALTDYLYGQ